MLGSGNSGDFAGPVLYLPGASNTGSEYIYSHLIMFNKTPFCLN